MMLNLKIAAEQLLILFEQHLYLIADPIASDNLPALVGHYVKTQMNFSGPYNGQFIMLFPEDKSKEIISNFLGLDPDDPEVSKIPGTDAASEIVNILGAHILSAWIDDNEKFSIGIPETSILTSDEQETFLQDKNITGILIDGEPIFLKIVLQ